MREDVPGASEGEFRKALAADSRRLPLVQNRNPAAPDRVAQHGLGERIEPRLHEQGVGLSQTVHDHMRRGQQIELDREREDDRFPQEQTRHQHEGGWRVFSHAAHR